VLSFVALIDGDKAKCGKGLIAEYYTKGVFFVDILYTDKAFTIIAPPGYYKFVVNNKGAIWNGVSTWSSPFTCE
jgi:hypothetical protein